jgi:hypothetical protein
MGKTVLLDDVAARAQGDLTTLRASGRESDADLPLAVLAELLRPAMHEIDALPGPQAQALKRRSGSRRETASSIASPSGWRRSVCSPFSPCAGPCSSWPTTCSGSTTRHARRSRSSLAACRGFTSRSRVRRARTSYPRRMLATCLASSSPD